MNCTEEIARPALRYHGGKWKIAPWIIQHFGRHQCFTDSFGGGCNLILRKERSYAEVYNDLNGDVVNFFKVLRDQSTAKELIRLVALTPFAREEFELAYEATDCYIEQARRLAVRSWMGFGSAGANANHKTGFRACSNRAGTTPADNWRTWAVALRAIAARMAGVIVENRPAAQVMIAHDAPTSLHYVDPPYVLTTRSNNKGVRQKYVHEMTDEHHREMAAVLRELKGMVVLSGYACDLYDTELFPDWQRRTVEAHADGGRDRTEVIWLNKAASRAIKAPAQMTMF